jgi:hypothetical protein
VDRRQRPAGTYPGHDDRVPDNGLVADA